MTPNLLLIYAVCAIFVSSFGAADKNIFESFDHSVDWVSSDDARYEGSSYEVNDEGSVVAGNKNLKLIAINKHYGLSKLLSSPISTGHPDGFVVQYEVNLPENIFCSGGYLKLLVRDESFRGTNLGESTPFTIMFGPDVCGTSTSKVHLIFRSENPITGEFEEKHMKQTVLPKKDGLAHLYTLELYGEDSRFVVKIDGVVEAQGSLLSEDDFSPAFTPPSEIPDPDDEKPEDWVDEKMMVDPSDIKPEGWDSIPEMIYDPESVMPEGWIEEDDGEWEAPLIPNPEYKGEWSPRLIENPDYQGVWSPRIIPNNAFFEEPFPLKKLPEIGAVAIEVLANDAGISFDSIMIGNDIAEATAYAEESFSPVLKLQEQAQKEEKAAKIHEEREASINEGGYLNAIYQRFRLILDSLLYKGYGGILSGVFLSMVGLLFIKFSRSKRNTKSTKKAEAAHKKDDDVSMKKDEDDADADVKEVEDDGETVKEEVVKSTSRSTRRTTEK